jgi:hypothetical protein
VGGYDLGAGGADGGIFLLADHGQNALLGAAVALAGWQVDAAEEPFEDGGVDYPAGSWIVQAPRRAVEEAAARFGLTFQAALSMPGVRAHLVDLPRLGVVHTWTSTQDVGWARYALDREGVPYELVSPDDLRGGGLARRFDVLLVPEVRGDFASLVHGIDPRFGPLAYTATTDYPSHGTPNASPDVTGGMGLEGLLELSRFVADGGLLVAVGNAGTLAVDGGLVRGVERLPASTLRSPGSEVAARVTAPRHPLAYGYEERTSVYRRNSALYDVPKRLRDRVVVQFGDEVEPEAAAAAGAAGEEGAVGSLAPVEIEVEEIEAEPVPVGPAAAEALAEGEMEVEETAGEVADEAAESEAARAPADGSGEELRDLVLSGWVSAPEKLAGKPALLDLPAGRGRVVLFAFNPLHRYLNQSDFRFLYNALLHWNDLP